MADSLKISLIQTELKWEDKNANLNLFDGYLHSINESDLIVLPEMFSTGFSMNPKEFAEKENGETVNWMRNWAMKKETAITGSLIIEEDGNFYNRLFFVYPNGEYKTYNKRHLFTLAGEEKVYSAGSQQLVLEYKGWKIMPLVCYDLRFPVWSRNSFDYEVLIYVANWPERRNVAWKSLLKARAIENQCYVVGLNRVGNDGNGIGHSGDSVILDALGDEVATLQANESTVKTVEISKEELNTIKDKFRFLNDRDSFTLQVE